MSARAAPLAAAAALLLAACGGDPAPRDEGPPDEESLRAAAQRDTLDPWPRYGLARLAEARGQWAEAIRRYGETINLLPPRRVTRPLLDLGVLHHRLGHLDAARRCYLEVLETQPAGVEGYRKNQDYRVAARGLRALALARGEPVDAALARRFAEELGGSAAEWEAAPPWLSPIVEPARAEVAPVSSAAPEASSPPPARGDQTSR